MQQKSIHFVVKANLITQLLVNKFSCRNNKTKKILLSSLCNTRRYYDFKKILNKPISNVNEVLKRNVLTLKYFAIFAIRTKVTVYVSNLVVRQAFGQKIKGRTHLSSPLSGGIVQYREPIGTGAFFF